MVGISLLYLIAVCLCSRCCCFLGRIRVIGWNWADIVECS